MDRKIIIITFGSSLLIIGAIFLLNIRSSKEKQNLVSGVAKSGSSSSEKMPSSILKEYSDPSGFNFSFPEDVKIDKKDDESLYANLSFVSDGLDGNIALTVSDAVNSSLDDWKKENNALLSGLLINESNLGNISGISFNNQDKITLVVVDQGVEFKIVVDYKSQKKYWQSVYNSILNSFSFVSSSPETPNTESLPAQSEEDAVFEGEEVVE